MPIPTDTYWNVKRLNIWFAVSAIVLMATMGWAVYQDFFQEWRQPQRDAKVWDAALVEERIDRDTTPEKEARLHDLEKQIAVQEAALSKHHGEQQGLDSQIRKMTGEQTVMEFQLNQLKAKLGVEESQLQDKITQKFTEEAKQIEADLAPKRKELEGDTEAVWKKKADITEAKTKLAAMTADVDALEKQEKKLTQDADALRKKLAAIDPDKVDGTFNRLLAKGSALARQIPLMQFVNPSEKVQQIVLPEVLTDMGGFKQVETVDRCMTCHVNVGRKEYTEANVLLYLESEVAAARNLKLAEQPSVKASDAAATKDKPGAVAMPEFWHLWAVQIAPELAHKPASLSRLSTLAKTVGPGKPIRVSINGKQLDSFSYVPDPKKMEDAASAQLEPATRDVIMAQIIKVWIGFGSGRDTSSSGAIGVKVEPVDDKVAAVPRLLAMKYVEDLRAGMMSTLPAETQKLLTDRYRRALIAEVNVARRKQGLAALDASPVLLAHPRLDLYVDVDSPHSFEAVGCTSCHDGSGQETNFVLCAHTPRPIWVDQKTGAPVLPVQLDASKAPAEKKGGDLSSMMTVMYPHDALVPSGVPDLHLAIDEHVTQKATTKPTTKAVAEKHAPDEPAENTPPVPYFDPVTGATGRAVSQMGYWKETYEPGAPRDFDLVYHEWDWPMRPPKYLQANCVRCHNDVNSIKNEAPKVFEGKSLFVNLGCVNCHQMDAVPAETPPKDPSDVRLIVANGTRKVGTDLRNVTAKLSKEYINTWIWAPKAFRPSTKMPHFFMLENNSSDEELSRTRQEARAITEYLWRTANKSLQLDANGQPVVDKAGNPVMGPTQLIPIPAGSKGSAEAGKALFATIGCQGCHTNTNEDTGEKRDGKAVTLAEKWVVTDLVKGGKLSAKMAVELGKAPDSKALTTRATELYDGMSYNERQVYLTENLAPNYSLDTATYPDGTAKPVFQHHGPELSGIGTKLTAGRTVDQARAWLFSWVKMPRHYSEYTVMPQLRLSDQQAIDLAEYLLAQKRPDDWKAELTPVDTNKLTELTGLFLRSRYSPLVAQAKADDDEELTTLATEALTTASVSADAAKAEVQQIIDDNTPAPPTTKSATPATTAPATKPAASAQAKDVLRMVFLGKKLIGNYGCMGCHAINGMENVSSPCANLSDWGQKGVDKLDFGYLDHHKLESLKKDEKTGEPLPEKIPMVNGLSAKASHLTGAEWRADATDGSVSEPVTADWPEVAHSRTAWITEKLKNTRVFDRGQALKEPDPASKDLVLRTGKPYDKLKMPTFYLSDREVDAIVTWVISNRDRLISPKLLAETVNEQAQRIARGRALVQKFNCVGCHQVEENVPAIQQYYKRDDVPANVPPSLRGEGNKIQHTWLFNFLKQVEPLRPKLFKTIRMPSFPILDQEATDIAAYFNAISVKESNTIDKTLLNVRKYIQTQQDIAMKTPEPAFSSPTTMPADQAKADVWALMTRAGGQMAAHDLKAAATTLAKAQTIATAQKISEQVGATTKPVSDRLKDAISTLDQGRLPLHIAMPGEDWYTRPEFAQAVDYIKDWALENNQISKTQLDPMMNKPEEIARNIHMVLFKVDFTSELYKAPYPFVETPRPDIDDARFKKGESLFYQMQCLSCHVLGDPNVPGAQKAPSAPSAPNLSLASRRLQRRWIRHWVQEPPIIQVGTAMPPFFTGLPVFNEHGQPWPRSQGLTPAEIEKAESEFGNTVDEQTGLLLDFIYAAGVRGYTGIQPVAGAAPAASAAPPPSAHAVKSEAPKAEAPKVETPHAEVPKAPAPNVEKPVAVAKVDAPKTAEGAKPQAGSVSIKGKVILEGKAPAQNDIDMSGVKECAAQHPDPVQEQNFVVDDKGDLKNVVVYVSAGLQQTSFNPPSEAAVIDQQGCMYHPHVTALMIGQPLMIRNSDGFLHNVHSLSQTNPSFNFAQPNKDQGKPVDPLKAPESFRIKCDVHPWMSAYIVAVDNPYFAVSGDDGSFSIANLPPGDYTLTAWQEQLGSKEIPVKVEAGKPVEIKISLAAP